MEYQQVVFRQYVLKTHSRCDLACDHCYIYEHADTSWSGRPVAITSRTAAQVAFRIAEHAKIHRPDSIRVVLHGGEPLLLGVSRTAQVLEMLRESIAGDVTRLDLRIHTNGVLLDNAFLRLFDEYDVKVGISLDGDRQANDRHRLYRNGRSSYDKVVAALTLLRSERYRHLYAGLLCTIDIENDPLAVYEGLLEHEPPRVDLLLPHATWENQPPGLIAKRSLDSPGTGGLPDGSGEYGAWLRKLFDAWHASGRPVPIRTFDSILAALHGRPSQTESLGLVPADLLVIETDGSIEQADSMKTAYDGAPATGFNVFDHDLDTAASHPGFTGQQLGIDGLSAQCRSCPVVGVCGGGLYAHRYAPASGFDNPSVYCRDLTDIIMHIQDASDAPSRASGSGAASPARDQPHGLVQDEFDALAAGYGTADTIYRLGEAQKSISRDLLARIAETGPQHDERFTRAWDLLATLDRTHPAAVEQVLAHPYVRVWAVKVLESRPATYQDAGGDLAHLGSLVASAALRAGVAAELSVPVLDEALRLPTFGALALTAAPAEAVIEIRADGSADVRAGDERHRLRLTEDGFGIDADGDPRWQQLRRISADGLEVALEDTDPYRDCHQHAAGRLSAAEAGHWEADFREAIAFTDKFLPNYAPGLRAGLATVMPMARSQDGTKRSAAARHAFGAVGAARPDDPAILALLLVHEFQHVKLGAVLDLYELYDTTDTEARHYAPWRPDPRPLEGLLQGTYAHVAVTEFWRVRRTLPDADGSADVQFARWREHTREAVDQLLASGSLTALGERFVRTMGETVARWLDEPVSRDALDRSHRSAREHRAAFERSMAARR